MKNWLRIGKHPVDLEVWAVGEYPHRYRLLPQPSTRMQLFVFPANVIHDWTGQLQGGLSAAGGVVVGAAGDFPARRSVAGEAVYPQLRGLTESAMLRPETYTLSPQNQLLVHRALDLQSARYVGVQLPEGGVEALLETQDAQELRGELIIASPGVVNVITPR